jgi:antirestriction protein ArdC
VAFDHLDGNVAGYSVGKDLAINPVAVHPHKTMLHEVGHIVLGHTEEDRVAEYRQHRGLFEFQAESTAYLTGHELDLLDEGSASESRNYIQTWLQGERPPDLAVRQVFRATDQILRAGYPDVERGEA